MAQIMKLKEIKRLVKLGQAERITSPMKDTYLETVGYSVGTHGVNGGLLKEPKSGKLYAITERGTALFYHI